MSEKPEESRNNYWYRMTCDDVLRQLECDARTGLSDEEAARRLEQYGPNILVEKGGKSRWQPSL